MMYTLAVLRQGAPRPVGACRCPLGETPSSSLNVGFPSSSTLGGPPELECGPECTVISDEKTRRNCDQHCDGCHLRSPSRGNRSGKRPVSRWMSALNRCNRQGPPLFSRDGHDDHRRGRHQWSDCSRCTCRPRSVRQS